MSRTRTAHTAQKPATTPTTLFNTANTRQPFTWGRVPARDEALTIAGQPGAWAYVGAMECGRFEQYVLLVRYSERLNAWAVRSVVPAGWVLEDQEVGVR